MRNDAFSAASRAAALAMLLAEYTARRGDHPGQYEDGDQANAVATVAAMIRDEIEVVRDRLLALPVRGGGAA